MMPFENFRRGYLDNRVKAGRWQRECALDMALAYLVLASDEREKEKARAFIEEVERLMTEEGRTP